MSRRAATAALLIALVRPAGAGAATDASVLAVLRELGRESAAVQTLRAHFVQEKHVAIVRDVLRSAGTFALDKRGRIVWDVVEPDPVRIVIGKDGVFAGGKRVGPQGDAAAKFSPLPLLEGLNDVFAGVSERTATSFDVTLLDRDRLRLVPRSPRLAEWVSSIDITLGSAPRVPLRVELREPSGDRTEIRFSDVEMNPKLDAAVFAP